MKWKKARDSMTESEAIRGKRKFAIELKQLVHQKCVEINHYVSGCDSPFSYLHRPQLTKIRVVKHTDSRELRS